MSKRLSDLLEMLRPDDFRGRPILAIGNQSGHFLIVGFVFALWVPWWLILIGFAAWEFYQWRYWSAQALDCLLDWVVVAYAAIISAALQTVVPDVWWLRLIFTIPAVFILAIGAWAWRQGRSNE